MKRSRLALPVCLAALCVVAGVGPDPVARAQVRAATVGAPASNPLVGVWLDRGKGGMRSNLDEVRLLDLRANGEFQWTVEDTLGKPKDTSEKGTYTVFLGDGNGLPGAVLAKLSGADGDYRGKVEFRNGNTYWLALFRGSESSQPNFASSWKKCQPDSTFLTYARSADGGKTWRLSEDKAALRTTVWYTAP